MDTAGPTIMLVDDEPDILEVCIEALSDLAFRIVTAENGLVATSLLEKEPVDLIVSDLRMPGADGMDIIKAIDRIAPGTDVIILTGFGTIDNAVECVKLGAVDYLLKPFRIENLRAAVSKALNGRSLRKQQEAASDLSRMLDLNSALSTQPDAKTLIKRFLSKVNATFLPDGIALFYNNSNGASNSVQRVLVGPYFRKYPSVRSWFESFARSLASRKRPMLLDGPFLRQAFNQQAAKEAVPATALGVSLTYPVGSTSALVVLRANGAQAYTVSDLQLLTLFAAHASVCFESHWACSRLKSVNDEIVLSLVHAVEAKDTYTRGHSERVSRYAAELATFLGLSQSTIDLVRTAGMLHDVGKIGVPDNILNKPTILEAHELPLIRRHPAIAHAILRKVESLTDVIPIVYHHHESYDGSGYPDGLRGENIPFLARMISVVDGFEAMTSSRAYHKARSVSEALAILANGAGQQWDPKLVEAWRALLDSKGLPVA